jgi:hypothetical protein
MKNLIRNRIKYYLIFFTVIISFTFLYFFTYQDNIFFRIDKSLSATFVLYKINNLVVVDKKCNMVFNEQFKFHSSIGAYKPNNDIILDMNLTKSDQVRLTFLIEFDYYNLKNQSIVNNNYIPQIISNEEMNYKINLIQNKHSYNSQDDVKLEEMLTRHFDAERFHKNIAIFGLYDLDYDPWIESLILMKSLNQTINVNTIDYKAKNFENKMFKWMHTTNYLMNKVDQSNTDYEYDMIISHYTLNKIGMGRYGEETRLDADFDMIKLYDCMLKKDGILFLTVSFSKDDEYVVYYNIHRVYNSNRLKFLLKEWIVLDEILFNFGADKILVLKKRA